MILMYMMVFVFLVVASSALRKTKSNIIVILTDDQDVLLNGMVPMASAIKLIGDEGTTFQNSFVNTPVCCPSRSTILTGKYLHNTGVRNNSLAGNCSSIQWQRFHEPFTFASVLKSTANYTTFYAGKYLNEYGNKASGGTMHVPPGYDWWLGLKGNSCYYNYTLSVNGTAKEFSDEYLTDVMKAHALSFLNQKHLEESAFFMMLSTPAAHAPFTPAPRHKDTFPEVKAIRTPSFNFSAHNKHWLLTMPPKSLPSDVSALDDIQRHRLQTLLAVDEMVEEVLRKLKTMNVLNDTYIIFTSDNGYHIGQFVQPWDKRQPYETDIRVPLLVRGPNIRRKYISELLVSSVDLAPTILSMAGIEIPSDMDGQSFLQHILDNGSDSFGERNILIEYFGEASPDSIDKRCPWIYDANLKECRVENWCKCQDSRNNTYACVRRLSGKTNFKYCRFSDSKNFIEAYDLQSDPFELSNVYPNVDLHIQQHYEQTLTRLQNCKGITCYE